VLASTELVGIGCEHPRIILGCTENELGVLWEKQLVECGEHPRMILGCITVAGSS